MPTPRLLEAALQLLAPERCPACEAPLLPDDAAFCGACEPLIDDAPAVLRPPSTSASLHVYGGPLADAIRRYKYGPRSDLARALGARLAAAAPLYGGRVDAVLPVPLHASRLRSRGFNQSALLARALARALGVPLDIGSVRRTRPTPPQAGLDLAARRDNVRGAFAVTRIPTRRPLVVDDVRTTGATLAEVCATLRAAGAVEIHTLTLAWAEP